MKHLHTSVICVHAAVGLATCAVLTAPAFADDPDVIYIKGTVRDFLKSHPDFNISNATGHVAGSAALVAPENRPSFAGAGFEVGTQWRTKNNVNIAPHMFYNGGAVLLGSAPQYNSDNVTIDSWNSADGTYGGDNVGGAPPMVWPATLPSVQAPTGLPPYPGNTSVSHNVSFAKGASPTISASFQCSNLATDQGVTLNIAPNSNITIYATGSMTFSQNTKIVVPETSTLHIYFAGNFQLSQGSEVNMTQPLNPARCVITNLGNSDLNFNQTGGVCAQIVSPGGAVKFNQVNEFFGTVAAKGLTMDQGTKFHWDGIPKYMCDDLVADVQGASSGSSTGAVTSGDTFHDWFTDVLGTNMSNSHTIALVRNSSGVYEYLDNAFFPIDHMLFGNEGAAHNFNFTYVFSATFEHHECADTFFEFNGADDAWVYIEGKLAMDLGGVMPLVPQTIEMDRLGLVDGETYRLHFFFAQRNPFNSVFRIRTNLVLESTEPFAITAQHD